MSSHGWLLAAFSTFLTSLIVMPSMGGTPDLALHGEMLAILFGLAAVRKAILETR